MGKKLKNLNGIITSAKARVEAHAEAGDTLAALAAESEAKASIHF